MEDEINRAKIVKLLEEIRDNQRVQLERQAEAIALQKQQRALVEVRMGRARSPQDRPELLQERSSKDLRTHRAFNFSFLSIFALLLILIAWITFSTR